MKTDAMHVVRPRAAGLDVHKMEITATVRICEGEGEPVRDMCAVGNPLVSKGSS